MTTFLGIVIDVNSNKNKQEGGNQMHESDFKNLICIKCSKPFTVTAAEQSAHQQKGTLLPKRCPHCRKSTNMHKGKKPGT
ncbi:MAG: zinc-ribbon domain-containing protein [Heliobacteriaceae bacterium]|jgi:DNA-directed RNA polymerase subunit RPC12/RpoP|nr:zinc-ribbon domain-containing protein [Heliobacteriaceae bacterium]